MDSIIQPSSNLDQIFRKSGRKSAVYSNNKTPNSDAQNECKQISPKFGYCSGKMLSKFLSKEMCVISWDLKELSPSDKILFCGVSISYLWMNGVDNTQLLINPKTTINVMHLSMLSRWGGRPGIGRAFEPSWTFLFKCPTAGHLWIVKIATESQ